MYIVFIEAIDQYVLFSGCCLPFLSSSTCHKLLLQMYVLFYEARRSVSVLSFIEVLCSDVVNFKIIQNIFKFVSFAIEEEQWRSTCFIDYSLDNVFTSPHWPYALFPTLEKWTHETFNITFFAPLCQYTRILFCYFPNIRSLQIIDCI